MLQWVHFQLSISIHALREEGDSSGWMVTLKRKNFYPRPPRGGRLASLMRPSSSMMDFYPRPPRGGRPVGRRCGCAHSHISIHALREEGDRQDTLRCMDAIVFLSTPSARRATSNSMNREDGTSISIHALREEGDRHHPAAHRRWRISIHALREEGDAELLHIAHKVSISIHALREEGDVALVLHGSQILEISIHALREEGDLEGHFEPLLHNLFLSTPSARRATATSSSRSTGSSIFLSTPSARRATGRPGALSQGTTYFYPRPPRGGRQQKQRQNLYFLINYTTFCTNLEEP